MPIHRCFLKRMLLKDWMQLSPLHIDYSNNGGMLKNPQLRAFLEIVSLGSRIRGRLFGKIPLCIDYSNKKVRKMAKKSSPTEGFENLRLGLLGLRLF